MRALRPTDRARLNGERQRSPGTLKLDPEQLSDLERTVKKQWRRYRKELDRCQAEFSESAVHNFRVETRRLLSLIELFAGLASAKQAGCIERSLKCYLDIFDRLRDTQVQLLSLEPMLSRFSGAQQFHAFLLKRQARFAKTARKDIKKVRSSKLAKEVGVYRRQTAKKLKKLGADQAAKKMIAAITRAHEKTRNLQARADSGNTATIHKTRVAFKHFRYMVERLAGYVPAITEPLLARMHDYQTLMGEIQDAEVLLAAFDKFVRKQGVPKRPAARFEREWQRRRDRRIRAYLQAAHELSSFWPWLNLESGTKTSPGSSLVKASLSRPRMHRNAQTRRKRSSTALNRGSQGSNTQDS